MAIRNKFAHIAEIDSFTNYFNIIKSSKERKKELIKWFPNLKWESTDIEGLYKVAFFFLTFDLLRVLNEIEMRHCYEKGLEQGEKSVPVDFMNIVKSSLQETERGSEILKQIFEKMLKNNGANV